MSTQTTTDQAPTVDEDYSPQRPYRDYSALELFESLEAQCNRGKGYNEAMVWELAIRACELEELQRS